MSGTETPPRRVAVVGAGIVGVSAALYLRRDGHEVTLLDGRAPGTGTSFGNAGGIVTSGVVPVSTPSLWRQVPRMLLDRNGAVRIRPAYLPRLSPWLLRWVRAGRPDRVEASSRALAALLAQAMEAHRELIALSGAEGIVRPVGWFKVYETEAGFAATAFDRDLMQARGISFEVLGPDEIRQLEPALSRRFVRGLFHPDSAFASLPHRLVQAHAAEFVRRGGAILQERARALERREGGGVRVAGELGIRDFDAVVVTAGAWSGALARQAGDRVPLDTERGYHLNLDPGEAGELRRPTVFPERGFVLAPMQDGIRLTSGVELAGLDAPPDFRRIRRLLPQARLALPGLGDRVTREWMGHRPSTPDSLPVIGASPRWPAVVYAFGHGHLGLTLGPITGRLAAAVVGGRAPGLDLAPYRPDRF